MMKKKIKKNSSRITINKYNKNQAEQTERKKNGKQEQQINL